MNGRNIVIGEMLLLVNIMGEISSLVKYYQQNLFVDGRNIVIGEMLLLVNIIGEISSLVKCYRQNLLVDHGRRHAEQSRVRDYTLRRT